MTASKRTIQVEFNPVSADGYTFTARRLRVDKLSAARPGASFVLAPAAPVERGAHVVPVNVQRVTITYQNSAA